MREGGLLKVALLLYDVLNNTTCPAYTTRIERL
jgi:hypothetical protein